MAYELDTTKNRISLFTTDRGPTTLNGKLNIGEQVLQVKLLKAHPSEKVKGFVSVELAQAPYSVVGGGFLWPAKSQGEGEAVMYGTVTIEGINYKVNLYRGKGDGKGPVFSGPLHPVDEESAPRAKNTTTPDTADGDW